MLDSIPSILGEEVIKTVLRTPELVKRIRSPHDEYKRRLRHKIDSERRKFELKADSAKRMKSQQDEFERRRRDGMGSDFWVDF